MNAFMVVLQNGFIVFFDLRQVKVQAKCQSCFCVISAKSVRLLRQNGIMQGKMLGQSIMERAKLAEF